MKKCQCDENPWTFDEEQNQWQRGNRAWLPKKPKSACDCDIMYCDRCGDMMFHHGMVVPTASRWEYEDAKKQADLFEAVIEFLARRIEPGLQKRSEMIAEATRLMHLKQLHGDKS